MPCASNFRKRSNLRNKRCRLIQSTLNNQQLLDRFLSVRKHTEAICSQLNNEDYSVQPAIFVSPPKWHLAHSTWFFEQFVLTQYHKGYKVYNDDFAFLFNSYYNNVGKRVLRPNRGLMTRPSVEKVYSYRAFVNEKMKNRDPDEYLN